VVEASPNKHKWDDKMAALRAARRAKGLCMKCGDTYNPQHRCPKQVPLHVLEEVLDIFQLDKSDEALSDSTSQESDEELLTLSYCASVGIQGKRTIRLQGLLQGREVLILVYSGSSATFINEQLVQTLKLPLTSTQPMPVTVADGGKLIASSVVNNLTWWSQGNTFTHDTRVLPLGVYDLILGMDWLEKHSPMWVDWKRKEMRFTLGKKDNIGWSERLHLQMFTTETQEVKRLDQKRRCCSTSPAISSCWRLTNHHLTRGHNRIGSPASSPIPRTQGVTTLQEF
jgi:hypothetical protein